MWVTMDQDLEALVAQALAPTGQSPASDADGAQPAAQEPTEAQLFPHAEVVVLDKLGENNFVLTHLITNERVEIRGQGDVSLVFDEEGFGVVVPPGEEQPQAVEELFKFQVYYASKVGYILCSSQEGFGKQTVRLNEFQGKCEAYELTMQVGATLATKHLQAVCYRWPRRPCARIMICAKSLYDQLGLSQFSGESWRWIAGSWRRWQSCMRDEFGMEEHVLPSTLMKELSLAGGGGGGSRRQGHRGRHLSNRTARGRPYRQWRLPLVRQRMTALHVLCDIGGCA